VNELGAPLPSGRRPGIGGVDATSRRSREASFNGADGVVENGPPLLKHAFRNTSAIPTTPSAPLRWRRIFFLMAQPPLLYQEGNCPTFIHGIYDRAYSPHFGSAVLSTSHSP
jgi:hypothetical protein